MVLDSPNMEFLFGLDMLRKHQVALLIHNKAPIDLGGLNLVVRFLMMLMSSVHHRFEGKCLESWWRRSFRTIFARFVLPDELFQCSSYQMYYFHVHMHELLFCFFWQPSRIILWPIFLNGVKRFGMVYFRKRHSASLSGRTKVLQASN